VEPDIPAGLAREIHDARGGHPAFPAWWTPILTWASTRRSAMTRSPRARPRSPAAWPPRSPTSAPVSTTSTGAGRTGVVSEGSRRRMIDGQRVVGPARGRCLSCPG